MPECARAVAKDKRQEGLDVGLKRESRAAQLRRAAVGLDILTIARLSIALVAVACLPAAPRTPRSVPAPALPIRFEPSGTSEFRARGGHQTITLKPGAATIRGTSGAIGMTFPHSARTGPTADDPHPSTANYFLGSDPANWRTNIPAYSRVRYRNLYPGIDLVFYGNAGRLEYDFTVAPGADPSHIRIALEGAERIALNERGDLVIAFAGSEVAFLRPSIYQDSKNGRHAVTGGYRLSKKTVRFQVGSYDHTLPLTIDPVLTYATFFGGASDEAAYAAATDPSGNAYIAGYTASGILPTTIGALERSFVGGYYDSFVAKFSPTGALLYSTYLGGTGDEEAYGLAVDSQGNAYITGYTTSADFPVTTGAIGGTLTGPSDAFVAKLNPAGTVLDYSSFLGGSGDDTGYGIAVDGSGNAFVTGSTSSTNFPVSTGSYRGAYSGGSFDGFVTAISAYGTSLLYSTYLGGSDEDVAYAIAVDGLGNAYVAGATLSSDFPNSPGVIQASKLGSYDAFVASLNASGTALNYSTFLGGSSDDHAYGVGVDSSGNAYVTGYTASTDFPHTAGVVQPGNGGGYDAFVTKINPSGIALVYSTFLGGSGDDYALAIAVDSIGNAYLTGDTSSTNFPVTADAVQTGLAAEYGAFVAVLNSAGTALSYGTYLGGSGFQTGYGIALSPDREFTAAGYTLSPDFPVTAGAAQTALAGGADAFLASFSALPLPQLSIAKSHTGNFGLGQNGAVYSVTVNNGARAGVTSGIVAVTEAAPSGLKLVSMAGNLWDCPSGGTTCTRSDPLAPGSNYPPITVTVNVADDAQSPLTNQVTVSGGGSATATASDTTTITPFTFSPCDVSLEGNTNVADVQKIIDEALGAASAANDLNQDGVVNVADVQIVINAALGLGCAGE